MAARYQFRGRLAARYQFREHFAARFQFREHLAARYQFREHLAVRYQFREHFAARYQLNELGFQVPLSSREHLARYTVMCDVPAWCLWYGDKYAKPYPLQCWW